MLQVGEIDLQPATDPQTDSEGLAQFLQTGAQGQPPGVVLDAGVDRGGAGLVRGFAPGARADGHRSRAPGESASIGHSQEDGGPDAVGGPVPEDGGGGHVADVGGQGQGGGGAVAQPQVEAAAVGGEVGHRAMDELGAGADVETLAQAPARGEVQGVVGGRLGGRDEGAVVGPQRRGGVGQVGEVDAVDAEA